MARLADGGGRRGAGARVSARAASGALAPHVELSFASAHRGERRFFAAEAERLARLCHRMAERFARGGRLVAFGVSPSARSDARHVAVEFVHPVIVGKRALPAHRPRRRGRRRSRARSTLLAEPGRHRDRVRGRRGRGRRGRALRRRPRAGLPDDRVRPRRRRVGVRAADDDPFIRQELVETLYHVLWELVHVFFDHRGLLEGRDARPHARRRRVELPVPVPGRARGRPRAPSSTTCGARCSMKAEEVGALRAQTLEREPRALLAAAAARCARASTRAASCWRFGNGGSATDAMDVVADFRRRRRGGRGDPRARPDRGLGDPDGDRQRHRHRGDLRAPGDRLRPRGRRAARALDARQLARTSIEALVEARRRGLRHDRDGRLRRRAGRRPRGSPTTSSSPAPSTSPASRRRRRAPTTCCGAGRARQPGGGCAP